MLILPGIEEKNIEIKLKTFGIPGQNGPVILEVNSCCSRDLNNNVVGISFIGQDVTKQKLVMNQYTQIQGDYMGIMRNPSALIPPIFMTDSDGRCLEWNDAMEKLSGFRRIEMTNRMLLGEVFTLENFGCRVKDHTLTKLRIILHRVISGQDAEKSLFRFCDREGNYVETLLTASKRTDAEGNITGVFFFLHVASPELQYALEMQRISEQATAENLHKLAYLRQEIKKPLDGIAFIQNLMGSSDLSKEQMWLLKLNTSSREQLHKIIHDTDIQSIEEWYDYRYSKTFFLFPF